MQDLIGDTKDSLPTPALRVRPLVTAVAVALAGASWLGGCASQPAEQAGVDVSRARLAFQKEDFVGAARLLSEPAMKGDAEAQYALGYMYYYGQGVPKDLYRARSWLEHSARQGHKDAQKALTLLTTYSRLPGLSAQPTVATPSAAPTPSAAVTAPAPAADVNADGNTAGGHASNDGTAANEASANADHAAVTLPGETGTPASGTAASAATPAGTAPTAAAPAATAPVVAAPAAVPVVAGPANAAPVVAAPAAAPVVAVPANATPVVAAPTAPPVVAAPAVATPSAASPAAPASPAQEQPAATAAAPTPPPTPAAEAGIAAATPPVAQPAPAPAVAAVPVAPRSGRAPVASDTAPPPRAAGTSAVLVPAPGAPSVAPPAVPVAPSAAPDAPTAVPAQHGPASSEPVPVPVRSECPAPVAPVPAPSGLVAAAHDEQGPVAATATPVTLQSAPAAPRPRYTLHLLSSRSKDDLMHLVQRHRLGDGVAWYTVEQADGVHYRLIFGGFDSVAAAKAALQALPEALYARKPWINNFPEQVSIQRFNRAPVVRRDAI